MSDKRTPHTDALDTLGMIHQHEEKRDAIHLGVEPIEAGSRLTTGEHVCIIDGKAYSGHRGKAVGIVDPFLPSGVEAGQRFWLVVYPRQITSLRHVWEHPDFAASPYLPRDLSEIEQSKQWIEDYAARLSGEDYEYGYVTITYDELMEYAESWINPTSQWGGDYLVKGGLLEGCSTDSDFWKHFEIITGKKPAGDDKPNFFSCSC